MWDPNLFMTRPERNTENSNPHGCEPHKPSIKGTKLLLVIIKAIIIIRRDPDLSSKTRLMCYVSCALMSRLDKARHALSPRAVPFVKGIADCIWSIILSQSPISIAWASFQRNTSKELDHQLRFEDKEVTLRMQQAVPSWISIMMGHALCSHSFNFVTGQRAGTVSWVLSD